MDLDLQLIHFKWAGLGVGQELAGPDHAWKCRRLLTQLTGGLLLSVLTHI